MKYPVIIKKEPDYGFSVIFPDIPEAITCGDNLEHARAMAKDALITCMDFYFEDMRPVPMPSELQQGQEYIVMPHNLWLKVLLLNSLLNSGINQADLARKMNIPPQEVTRILNHKYGTKLDKMAAAFAALGNTLNLSVS